MSTETTNKKIKIDNGTTFGRTYTDKVIDAKLPTDLIATAKKLSLGVGSTALGNGVNLDGFTYDEATKTLKVSGGGSSESSKFNFIYLDKDLNITGDYDKSRINICVGGEPDFNSFIFGDILTTISNGEVVSADMIGFLCLFGAMMIATLNLDFQTHKAQIKDFTQIGKLSSHFITLTNSTAEFCFTYISTSSRELNTLDSLKTALTGKRLLCTGYTDNKNAKYISGEGENVVVGVVNKSDNLTGAITIDSSFTISDKVSPVD